MFPNKSELRHCLGNSCEPSSASQSSQSLSRLLFFSQFAILDLCFAWNLNGKKVRSRTEDAHALNPGKAFPRQAHWRDVLAGCRRPLSRVD